MTRSESTNLAALTIWLIVALYMGVSSAGAQSASFAWLSVGGESYRTPADSNPGMSGTETTVGFSGGIFVQGLFLGGAADVRLPRSFPLKETTIRQSGGSGSVLVGYELPAGKRFLLYPTAGIGIGGTQVRVTHAEDGTEADRRSRLHSVSGVMTMQINGDFTRQTGLAGGPVIGWSVGVRRSFASTEWRLRGGPGLGDTGRASPLEVDRIAATIALRVGWGVSAAHR